MRDEPCSFFRAARDLASDQSGLRGGLVDLCSPLFLHVPAPFFFVDSDDWRYLSSHACHTRQYFLADCRAMSWQIPTRCDQISSLAETVVDQRSKIKAQSSNRLEPACSQGPLTGSNI